MISSWISTQAHTNLFSLCFILFQSLISGTETYHVKQKCMVMSQTLILESPVKGNRKFTIFMEESGNLLVLDCIVFYLLYFLFPISKFFFLWYIPA